ncbi:VOC family protein [Kiloniella sp. b19]|uniref:VOC family protein n=1 Tax=Kiloniella sp. GXU_MW_B19 TaxID=3141326 RepID=UPI0031E3766D
MSLAAENGQPKIYMMTLHTAQFDRMKDFFNRTMEMDVIFENGEFAEFSSQGLRLSLVSHSSLSSFLKADGLSGKRVGSGVGIGFEYETVEAVDEAYARLIERGAVAVAAPEAQDWGEYTAFFADPDGNVHELVTPLK